MFRLHRAARPGLLLCAALTVFAACKAESAKRYPVRGQILALQVTSDRPDRRPTVTVKHEDIPGFMPAMTMGYSVKGPSGLSGFAAGDLFAATLVLDGGDLYLTDLKKTGQAALPADARPVRILDVMTPGDVVPDDALQDQAGTPRKLSDWRGQALAVTFVYTRCPLPDFCPLMDRRFGELQQVIAADPRLRDRVHLVSVTFDPAHDTPEVIRGHARARGADVKTWSYLTGTPAAIEHLTSRFGVSAIAEHDSPATFTHNLRTAIVDARGRLRTIHSGNEWTVDGLLAELREASAK